jgi:predicted metal-dependent HD superfamily phosphohydrolase
LSILGQSWELYEEYFNHVRKEYSVYPDFMYNPGRKKVIHHFLNMKRIFKTDEFFNKYEEAARKNLAQELKIL